MAQFLLGRTVRLRALTALIDGPAPITSHHITHRNAWHLAWHRITIHASHDLTILSTLQYTTLSSWRCTVRRWHSDLILGPYTFPLFTARILLLLQRIFHVITLRFFTVYYNITA